MKCKVCKAEAVVGLRSHNAAFCEQCFLAFFRRQLLKGIQGQNLLSPGDKVLVAVSGGKDSLGLMLELNELGYNTSGVFIDLGIPEASGAARVHVENFCAAHELPLQVVDLARENLAIPDVKQALRRPVCSACGKIKRYFFNRVAQAGGYDAIATGHNLDDEIGRLMSNTLRWDCAYLGDQGPLLPAEPGFTRKIKPLWRLTEFETANYAFLRKIPHHASACPYSQGASFAAIKKWFHRLDAKMPGRKLDFYQGFLSRGRQAFANCQAAKASKLSLCPSCGSPTSSGSVCGICRIRDAVTRFKTANSK